MAKTVGMFFWKRLDHPGHDSCRLLKLTDGWRLSGAAVFRDSDRPCHFHYEVSVNPSWRTRGARVFGYLGGKPVDLRIRLSGDGVWRVNGILKGGLYGCVDLDLAFTPATNLIVLRRLSLRVGQRVDAPAAWLQFPQMRLVRLPQSYHRIGRREYRYEAPSAGYTGTLHVLPSGAVSLYPGLFEQVTSGQEKT